MKFWITLTALVLPALAQAYTFDSDVPQGVRDQITQDMAFIKAIKGNGATPLHQKVFGTVDGVLYGKFFETRVTAVGMNDCGGGKAVACVIPFYDSSKIWLTRNYTDFSHPQVAKMMVVFHESRHTEDANGNWSHATCPTPFLDDQGHDMKSIWTGATLAGEPACDVTSIGSYGSSTIMLKNIQKFCTNCTDKVKMDSGIYSDDQFKRITGSSAKAELKKDLYSSISTND
ncbi:hypothetical protein WDW37_15955 [Bdellovibrionota bacterium FG-1]